MHTNVLKVEIIRGNAAFNDDVNSEAIETARILRALADKITHNTYLPVSCDWPLFDVNGNCVGHAKTVKRRC